MKYEPARGVVALQWHERAPSDADEYGCIIAETWIASLHLGWSTTSTPEVAVRAQLRALRWDRTQNRWMEGGELYDPKRFGEIKRWARLEGRTTRINVTVGDWA